jgi:hypothetical protein
MVLSPADLMLAALAASHGSVGRAAPGGWDAGCQRDASNAQEYNTVRHRVKGLNAY